MLTETSKPCKVFKVKKQLFRINKNGELSNFAKLIHFG